MSRATFQAEMLSAVLDIMAEFGEPIEVGVLQGGQDPVTGDQHDPTFTVQATPLGVLMALDGKSQAEFMRLSGGSADRLPTFVAYLPPVGFVLTAQRKLRLKGKVYDPMIEPNDIGGMGAAWELYLRASNG